MKKLTEIGWVVESPVNGILEHSYHILKSESKSLFLEQMPEAWQHYEKEGYKCVKAKRTIELI